MRRITHHCLAALGVALLPMLAFAGPVNVNTADAETISAALRGIGMTKAQAIVAWRAQNGPFKTADDLVLVKGIGERTVEINRADILLDGSTTKPRK
ncbi:MAG: helix-hairpin-helix domain-containing protein [Woeseia sp.]